MRRSTVQAAEKNNKVNKRALPNSEIKVEVAETPKVSLNILEKSLQQFIGSLVGVKEFDISTELNSLGLISISAIRIATQLYKKFGLNLPPKKLYRTFTTLKPI